MKVTRVTQKEVVDRTYRFRRDNDEHVLKFYCDKWLKTANTRFLLLYKDEYYMLNGFRVFGLLDRV
ncbi:hypothetical protein M2451_002033 [Dysgonomonas sp. PFB1-18]|uniref:hypothetical protein n=1 Tax=unclassified Dysgonomonas TaxID=2630389 RepID=UPI00247451C2|nr:MULTISPECIES: hypothetical protein [unclassified Dysgonomonas]MDH6309783.1 hypothetical protein [Dysgonomonas sp. PF1-14]MDH6339209.1 hypothetical protein [Dysgonomonas sp. PF1-16]MDH6380708.1 hypothetical protein [Dysgonomonas sp. PFB1-18]MDH6398204.1 hypothetical protein [Dysgonomonas sp. PF1-23]